MTKGLGQVRAEVSLGLAVCGITISPRALWFYFDHRAGDVKLIELAGNPCDYQNSDSFSLRIERGSFF
jgi:hypothetical protein